MLIAQLTLVRFWIGEVDDVNSFRKEARPHVRLRIRCGDHRVVRAWQLHPLPAERDVEIRLLTHLKLIVFDEMKPPLEPLKRLDIWQQEHHARVEAIAGSGPPE